MSAMLRTPNAVPSMFGEDIGLHGPVDRAPPLGRRLFYWLAVLGGSWGRDLDAVVARYCPAVVASFGLLFIVGKPILKAASVAVGLHP